MSQEKGGRTEDRRLAFLMQNVGKPLGSGLTYVVPRCQREQCFLNLH